MRAGMLDMIRRNRLSKTKNYIKSLPVPHRRLSPEFHSRPQFAHWGHPLPGKGVMLRRETIIYPQNAKGTLLSERPYGLWTYLVVSTLISPEMIFLTSSSTSTFSSALTCWTEPASP